MTRRRNQPMADPDPDPAPDLNPDPEAAARDWLNAAFRRRQDDVAPDDDATPRSMNDLIRRATGRPDAA